MPADNFELPIVRLTYDLADLRALHKDLEKIAKSGKKEFVDLAKQAQEVVEELETAKEHQEELFNKTHATRIAQEKVHKVLKAETKIREIDKAYLKEKKKHLKEQRRLQKHAQREEIAHLRLLAKQGGDLAPAAKRELRGRGYGVGGIKTGAGKVIGGAGKAFRGGGAIWRGVSTAMKSMARVFSMIEKSWIWKTLMKLLDFNGLFRFNKQMNAAAGGIDALRGSLRDGASAFMDIEGAIWDNSEALHDMTTNLRHMVKADERLAALSGFETSSLKAQEFIDTLNKGTDDVTVQAIALGRVVGMEGREVATYMGEFIRNMGVSVADVGATFAGLIADASEAGISQRFFIDQIRNATSALGMYEFNLGGVSKMLADMTKNSLQPAEVAMRDFQTMLQMGKGLNIGQLGASFQVAMRDSGFQQGMTALTRMIGSRLDPAVFGEGLADRLGGMQRPQFNAMLDEMIATKGLNLDQQRELRSVYDALHALHEGQRGDFFELRQAMQTGALGPDFMALMVNGLSQQYFQGAELRDLNAIQLENLASFIGISAEQLATMKDTIPTNEEIVKNLNQQAKGGDEQTRILEESFQISNMMQKALENPDKSFEIIMENLVRIIQRMIIRLVQQLMPTLIDLTTMMIRALGGLVLTMLDFVRGFRRTWMGGNQSEKQAREFGADIQNLIADFMGGTQATGGMVAFDKSILGRMQQGTVSGYTQQAGDELKRMQELVDKHRQTIKKFQDAMKDEETSPEMAKQMQEQVLKLTEAITKAEEAMMAQGVQLAEAGHQAFRGEGGAAKAAGAYEALRTSRKALENPLVAASTQAGGTPEREYELNDQAILRAFGFRSDLSEKDMLAAVGRLFETHASGQFKSFKGQDFIAAADSGDVSAMAKSLKLLGLGDGGLVTRPAITAFAEKGPEIGLPLRDVPKVMAETMARAGVGAGISIGSMHFHLPETAAANVNAFSQAVRRVVFEELQALNKAHRAV